MKTNHSPGNAEVTPKKKLKQARLPFKFLSDVSPVATATITRKRKLSASCDVSDTKLSKLSKENDTTEDPVIISDNDSKPSLDEQNADKTLNPYVNLVDTAWKKKQKMKKKKISKNKSVKTPNSYSIDTENETATNSLKKEHLGNCGMIDVDKLSDVISEIDKCSKDDQIKSDSMHEANNVIILEDSNDFTTTENDVNKTNNCENKPNNIDIVAETKILDEPLKEQYEYIMETNQDLSNSLMKIDSLKDKSTEDLPKSEVDETVPMQTTPKRSARNKAKAELSKNLNSSTNTIENESVELHPTTPKHTRSSSTINSQGDISLNDSVSSNLTPKQLQKKLESAKKKEEREKEKQERDKKRQQEKEEKARIKQEKEDQKKRGKEEKEEARRKDKEEKEEQKRKEKEEKEKQKELERKQREEKEEQRKKEKEEKEEQKRKEKEAKEEEKRKKQEALELEKQEADLKKKKAAEALAKFFVTKQKIDKDQSTINSVSKNSMLSNFTIKADMRLAPIARATLSEDRKHELEIFLQKQTSDNLSYMKCLKEGLCKPQCSGKTWPLSDKNDDDVIIVEDELPPIDSAGEILPCESAPQEKLRPKLLSFHENRRPPYWGTWRKRSASIKPRKPFGQDKKQLDYDVDSDEEWEEEQEGESLDGSAAGSDDEPDADEYEVDNVVFVPHGYLSDEEATLDEDDVLSLSPETQKARLKHLEDEFESQLKKPTEKLKPRMYGLLWETADGGKPEKCVDTLWNYFSKLSMIMSDPTPLLQPSSEPEEMEKKKVKKKKSAVDGEQKSPKSDKKKKTKSEVVEVKTPKDETKKNVSETKKNQPGINKFLTKLKST